MCNDLIYLIQYAIDTNQLKLQSAKTYTPLAKKIDLLHESNPMMLGFMLTDLFPEHNFSNTHDALESFIKTNPATTYSMLLEYSILLVGAADITNASTQKAAEAYTKKYPESYCSLTLRFLLARYYQSNGDEEKAKAYGAELKKIALKKKIELRIESEKKFATPESTWESLRQAMVAGDIEAALLCHIPGDPKYRELYNKLGKEIVKKIGEDMKPIEKIRADGQTAEYRARRKHKDIDKEIMYYIYFGIFRVCCAEKNFLCLLKPRSRPVESYRSATSRELFKPPLANRATPSLRCVAIGVGIGFSKNFDCDPDSDFG